MVRRLFRDRPPATDDRILYPGCGMALFPAAVERVCTEEGWPLSTGRGVDTDRELLGSTKDRGLSHVTFEQQDFLSPEMAYDEPFEYIIGDPPYVPIEGLSAEEKQLYKDQFYTASGRFDLYILFFEQAIAVRAQDGVLSFVTPEKFEYVDTAAPLRRLLTGEHIQIESIEHIDEAALKRKVTYG